LVSKFLVSVKPNPRTYGLKPKTINQKPAIYKVFCAIDPHTNSERSDFGENLYFGSFRK